MKHYKKIVVITTINSKSRGLEIFEGFDGWHVVIVGDKKSKMIASSENLTFLPWEEQLELGYDYAKLCPWNHYSRKNIGYLYAVSLGAEIIYDTDDDNIPYVDRWQEPEFTCSVKCSNRSKFINIYSYFSDVLVWPRGLPLDEIHSHVNGSDQTSARHIGVWQGLADSDPDVDAVFRLIFKKEINFEEKKPLFLPEGTYSPFNSQNTFWHQSVFPLLYLPATVSFRSTDIYRGYIAQRLMWLMKRYLGFTHATVYQCRNTHDLMHDFSEEWECYNKVKSLVKLLDNMPATTNNGCELIDIYRMLHEKSFVMPAEIDMVAAWLSDIDRISNGNANFNTRNMADGR